MAADSVDQYRAGETALIVKVPEAEPVVGGWRARAVFALRAPGADAGQAASSGLPS